MNTLPKGDLEFANRNTLIVACFGLVLAVIFLAHGWRSSLMDYNAHLKEDVTSQSKAEEKTMEAVKTWREFYLEKQKKENNEKELDVLIEEYKQLKSRK